jgi:hypothetical protein
MGKTDSNEAVARSKRKDWTKIPEISEKLTSENLDPCIKRNNSR